MGSRIDRFLGVIASGSAFLSGAVIVFMMVLVTFDAVGRKFGYPIPGGLELSEAMMVLVVYLSLMAVQRNRENVFVSIATHHLSARSQARMDAFASVLGLLVFSVFMWVGFSKALDAYQIREYRIAAISVPIWPFRWFIPFGLALLCLQLIVGAIQDWRGSRDIRREHVPEL